jgi:O-antigen ligase
MTAIEMNDTTHKTSRRTGTRRTTRGDRQATLQTRLTIALMVLLALAPLPLGSNRPVFWALGASLLGGVGAVYFLSYARLDVPLRAMPRWLTWAAVAGGLYLGWIVIQALPLGLGGAVMLPSGLSLTPATISLTPDASLLAAVRVTGYALIFVLMLQVATNRARAKRCVQALALIVTGWAVYALLALLQFGDTILLFDKWAYFGSATGPFVNRNSFATFLAMGLVAGAGLLVDRATQARMRMRATSAPRSSLLARLTDPDTMRTYLGAVAMLLVLATLLQTDSRMGVFAGVVGMALTVMLIAVRRGALGLAGLLAIPVVVLTIAGLVAWLYGGALFDRVGSLERDVNVRLELYKQIVGMIAQRPWTGWGADSFEVVYQAFRAVPVSPELVWDRTHSTYLAHWVESGVLAGSIPIVLTGWAFVACLHAALRRDSDIVLPAIGAGVIATGAVHSVVDFSLEMQANVWLFLALVALALGGHVAGPVRASSAPPRTIEPDPAAPDPDPAPDPAITDDRVPTFLGSAASTAIVAPDRASEPGTPAEPDQRRRHTRRRRA